MKKKLMKQASALVLGVCLTLTMILGKTTVKAATMASNPVTKNGITTWDCVYFGHYYQDEYKPKNPPANPVEDKNYIDTDGTEYCYVPYIIYSWDEDADEPEETIYDFYYKKQPIKWRVLSVDADNNAFVVADKGLDYRRYDNSNNNVTWATCSLRSWLNGYDGSSNSANIDYSSINFIDQAFSSAEQVAIREKVLENDNNSDSGTEGGNNTCDKVFLLSIDEIGNTSFGFNSSIYANSQSRYCKSTVYAARNGAKDDIYDRYDAWWLRSPGYDSSHVAYMSTSGTVRTDGYYVSDLWSFVVRPAMVINLSSSYITKAASVSANIGKQSAHSHSYISSVTKEATCSSIGIKQFKCSCGDVYLEEITKNSSNHIGEKEIRNYVAATEKTTGYSGDIYCKDCGVLLSEGMVTPVLEPSSSSELKKQTIKVKNRTIQYSNLKKRKITIKLNAKTDGDGALSYKIVKYPKGMKKYISVSKAGIVTFKKKAKKGTYQIQIIAKQTLQFNQVTKKVTIKVK